MAQVHTPLDFSGHPGLSGMWQQIDPVRCAAEDFEAAYGHRSVIMFRSLDCKYQWGIYLFDTGAMTYNDDIVPDTIPIGSLAIALTGGDGVTAYLKESVGTAACWAPISTGTVA